MTSSKQMPSSKASQKAKPAHSSGKPAQGSPFKKLANKPAPAKTLHANKPVSQASKPASSVKQPFNKAPQKPVSAAKPSAQAQKNAHHAPSAKPQGHGSKPQANVAKHPFNKAPHKPAPAAKPSFKAPQKPVSAKPPVQAQKNTHHAHSAKPQGHGSKPPVSAKPQFNAPHKPAAQHGGKPAAAPKPQFNTLHKPAPQAQKHHNSQNKPAAHQPEKGKQLFGAAARSFAAKQATAPVSKPQGHGSKPPVQAPKPQIQAHKSAAHSSAKQAGNAKPPVHGMKPVQAPKPQLNAQHKPAAPAPKPPVQQKQDSHKKAARVEELNRDTLSVLFKMAKNIATHAYAPYSSFRVGSVLLIDSPREDGRISAYTGCNIENASYSLTCCAERVAMFKAISDGSKKFKAMVLYASSEHPVSPCGACRQVLSEFAQPEMKIYSIGDFKDENLMKTPYSVYTVSELLPKGFKSSDMAKKK